MSVNVGGLEIADAANKLALHMGIDLSRLVIARNCHGIGNIVERGESCSAVEPLRLKYNGLTEEKECDI